MSFNYTKFKNLWNINKAIILNELQNNNKKVGHYIWYAFPLSKYYYGKNSPANPDLIFDNEYKNDTAKILSDTEWLRFFIKILSILYHRKLNYVTFFGPDAWKVCSSLDIYTIIINMICYLNFILII